MPTVVPAQKFSKRAVASLMGRYGGPELFTSIPFAVNTSTTIPKNINLARPLDSIKVIWRGRVVIGTANYSAVAPEAPQSIIQRIVLSGTHVRYNQIRPIDMTGATIFAWPRLFYERGSTLIINGVRQPELTIPLTQVGATFGNIATYDLEIHYHIPLGITMPPSSRIRTIPFTYYPDDWTDQLQLRIDTGDATSFGTLGGGGTTTFTAFGSGTGTPVIDVYLNYHQLGPLASSVQGAVVVRNEAIQSGGNIASLNSNLRLWPLAKQKTSNVMVKSGTILTGTTGGVQVYATLVDTLINRTQINLDNKPIRNNTNNYAAKEWAARQFNTVLPGGYLLFSFVDSMNPLTYFRGDRSAPTATLELVSDIISANANNSLSMVQEQVYGTPRGRV